MPCRIGNAGLGMADWECRIGNGGIAHRHSTCRRRCEPRRTAARAGRRLPPGVSTPLFHDKNTQHIGKSQSKRPHKMWKRPLTVHVQLLRARPSAHVGRHWADLTCRAIAAAAARACLRARRRRPAAAKATRSPVKPPCGADGRYSRLYTIRVRVQMMGWQKCRVVGKSRSVLITTNPMISTRTRSMCGNR
jgi:hypothetical protein